MKQTLLRLAECGRRGAGPEECAAIILERLPEAGEQRRRYLGQIGAFIATALGGVVVDPQDYSDF